MSKNKYLTSANYSSPLAFKVSENLVNKIPAVNKRPPCPISPNIIPNLIGNIAQQKIPGLIS